jgi:hypothetical protein
VNLVKKFILGVCLAMTALNVSMLSATEYMNMDFTPPEQGGYGTVFGTPSVESSVGPLQNALVFNAVTSYEQIRIDMPQNSRGYEIHYDVYTHNLRDSKYAFTVLFDTPEVRTMSFHGGLNRLSIYRPGFSGYGPAFNDDQVYHVGMWIDFLNNTWTVSLDGVAFQPIAFDAAYIESIRFSMAPAFGSALDAPDTYVALDNLVITSVPEPPAWSLVLTALVTVGMWSHRKRLHQSS